LKWLENWPIFCAVGFPWQLKNDHMETYLVDGKIGYVELAMKEFQLAEQLNRMPLNNAFLGKTFCSVLLTLFTFRKSIT